MAELTVGRSILEANDRLAEDLRALFHAANVKVINIISSPGAGKTTLLEKTLTLLKDRLNVGVIEGDIQTTEDAQRVAACGVKAVQIETKGACHLDGNMLAGALTAFDLNELDLLIIENVGNLVCPVEFDLGENLKVAVLSVTEGDDKPSKYPLLFSEAGVLIVNKIDLLPYIDCDIERIHATCRALNPAQVVFDLSCRTGEGLAPWVDWLEAWVRDKTA
jgi:hydrogenase nickel incorporation protein HypB